MAALPSCLLQLAAMPTRSSSSSAKVRPSTCGRRTARRRCTGRPWLTASMPYVPSSPPGRRTKFVRRSGSRSSLASTSRAPRRTISPTGAMTATRCCGMCPNTTRRFTRRAPPAARRRPCRSPSGSLMQKRLWSGRRRKRRRRRRAGAAARPMRQGSLKPPRGPPWQGACGTMTRSCSPRLQSRLLSRASTSRAPTLSRRPHLLATVHSSSLKRASAAQATTAMRERLGRRARPSAAVWPRRTPTAAWASSRTANSRRCWRSQRRPRTSRASWMIWTES
mmetsp:Transcript_16378/g.53342  ORF Transcript_16378/g.53342 Transcript_16378/m.53342 type:complete len:279 (+) Transcript_16378:332-1168(+)